MYEQIEITESIHGGVVESSYKKPTKADANRAGFISKIRGEAASSTTYSDISESTGKRRQRYVDHLKDISKLTCLVYQP